MERDGSAAARLAANVAPQTATRTTNSGALLLRRWLVTSVARITWRAVSVKTSRCLRNGTVIEHGRPFRRCGMRWVIAVVGATALLGAAPAALESAPAATSCRWRMVTTPRVPSYDPRVRPAAMNSVAAVSRTDVWAVGYWTIPIGIYAPTTLIWHWNGKRWAVEGGGLLHAQSSSLSAVAAARGNAWAVGRYPGGSLTEHWNGRRWSATPNPGGKGSALVGVAIVSSSDVWAVGRRTRGPLLLHWNGSKWLNVPAPSEADSFLGVTRIRGAAGVWVYGLEVTSEGSLGVAAWRWMGSASEHFSLPTPAGGPFSLAGGSMTAPSASSAWVV